MIQSDYKQLNPETVSVVLELGTCCHAGCPWGEQLVCLAKPLECSWWGRKLGSGWWVCSLGVLPPSEQMGLKEFVKGGGWHQPGKARRSLFLSKWPIHKMPPLLSPDVIGHCPVFPHLRGSFLSKGEEECCPLKGGSEPPFSKRHPFYYSTGGL